MRPLVQQLVAASKSLGKVPPGEPVPPMPRLEEIRQFLLLLDMPDASARRYLEVHLERLAMSLALIPAPGATGRVLELGAYMQMTPALGMVLGFREVRGAYFGTLGEWQQKSATISGETVFSCRFDHFNAELDPYPYPDASFDCVVACEIFEHFLHDPMHMLVEAWRLLQPAGTLLLTTPNVASATAVARILEQSGNPQLYSKFADPRHPESRSEVGHMREYTPAELRDALFAAGFDVLHLFTRNAPGYASQERMSLLLQLLGYPTEFRGEQMFCLARKNAGGPVNRYPGFLYEL